MYTGGKKQHHSVSFLYIKAQIKLLRNVKRVAHEPTETRLSANSAALLRFLSLFEQNVLGYMTYRRDSYQTLFAADSTQQRFS